MGVKEVDGATLEEEMLEEVSMESGVLEEFGVGVQAARSNVVENKTKFLSMLIAS